jgi:HD-GYP domain-containing protein (c-di-GMP phosphodiesterase class II)
MPHHPPEAPVRQIVEDTQIVPHLVRFAVGDERLSIHSMSTVAYAIALTTQRPEIIPDQPRPIGIGAPTHDIGLATAAAHRLSRDESVLTESEHTFLVKHPERGLSVLQEMQVADPIVLEIVADHHSAATDLPVHLQIVQLADSFDTLTNRPGRTDFGAYRALYTLRESSQDRYDQNLLRDFVLILGSLELDDNLTPTPLHRPLESAKPAFRAPHAA